MWSGTTTNAGNCHSEFKPPKKAASFRGGKEEFIK